MFNGDVQVTGSGAAVVVVVVVASVEGRSVVVSPPPQAVGAAIEESKKIVSDLNTNSISLTRHTPMIFGINVVSLQVRFAASGPLGRRASITHDTGTITTSSSMV